MIILNCNTVPVFISAVRSELIRKGTLIKWHIFSQFKKSEITDINASFLWNNDSYLLYSCYE